MSMYELVSLLMLVKNLHCWSTQAWNFLVCSSSMNATRNLSPSLHGVHVRQSESGLQTCTWTYLKCTTLS